MDLIDHKNTEFSKNIFLKIYVHSFQHISQITYDNIYTLANNQINASTTSKQNESFVYIVPWCHETNWEVTSFTARSATEAPLYNSECWLLFMMSRQNINCLNARSYFANNYHNLWYFDCVWCQVGNAAKCLCFKDKIVNIGNICFIFSSWVRKMDNKMTTVKFWIWYNNLSFHNYPLKKKLLT